MASTIRLAAVVASGVLTLSVAGLAYAQDPQPPAVGDRSIVPRCPIAADATYGFAIENPIKVGGGPLFGAARQRRYLDALRGPAGQTVRYTRRGTARAPDGTIVDRYEITYDGLAEPLHIYMDWYHFDDHSAPQGLTCGQPIALGLPPVDPFRGTEETIGLAVEQGPSRELAPIPLAGDSSASHGVMFDHFRLVARAARAAAEAGTPLDPKKLPLDLARQRLVIVAHALTCDGRNIAPLAVEIVPAQGPPPKRDGDYVKDAAIASLVPGFPAPPSSLAAVYPLATPRPTDTIKITYAEPACPAGATEVTLGIKFVPARPLETPAPSLPAGVAPADRPVRFQVVIDAEGALRRPFVLGGPPHAIQPATDTLATWKAEPARVNGAPLVTAAVLQVTFR